MSTLRSIDEVAAAIAAAAWAGVNSAQNRDAGQPARRIIVGIVGPPGVGKSTIADAVVERLNLGAMPGTAMPGTAAGTVSKTAALLPMDGFHLPQKRLVELGRRERMGAPDTFDVDGFLETLQALAEPAVGNSGTTVYAPGFDRTIEEAVPGAIAILPEFPIVIVEGNYLLLRDHGWERVAPLLDLSFYVQLDQDERLRRLIDRHVRFGKSADAARAWALGPDEANAKVIAATSAFADHIIELH